MCPGGHTQKKKNAFVPEIFKAPGFRRHPQLKRTPYSLPQRRSVRITSPWGVFPSSIARQPSGCQYQTNRRSEKSYRRDFFQRRLFMGPTLFQLQYCGDTENGKSAQWACDIYTPSHTVPGTRCTSGMYGTRYQVYFMRRGELTTHFSNPYLERTRLRLRVAEYPINYRYLILMVIV